MKQLDKNDINQEVFDLYDDYAHDRINRRQFMDKLSIYAVGGVTVANLMSCVMPNYGNKKIQVQESDSQLSTETIEYHSGEPSRVITAQLSRLKDADKKLPGIIVVHENRGLNPHIADVGRRAALAGFISISPDMLSPLGGYPGNDDDGRALQKQRDRQEMLEDFISAFEYLKTHSECDGNIGVVGFCFGGWISNMMAIRVPELKAAVPFYGGQPNTEDVSNIQVPLLLHFAELDKRVNAGWPEYEKALKEQGKEYIAHMYPEANHGFHNDTTSRYDEQDATLAWKRTIEFFTKKLIN